MAPRRSIPTQLLSRPFTVAEAAALGAPPSMLRGARFRRVFRGVYVVSELPDTLPVRLDAARLLVPGGVASCHTAGAVMRLPVPDTGDIHLRITEGRPRTRVAGIRVHGCAAPYDIQPVDGRLVTGPAQTFLDLAAHLSLVDLVMFGDAFVRRHGVAPAALVAAADRASGRGVRLARDAARLVRERVDSPRETMLRLLIVFAGLPEPLTGTPVSDADGGWLATPDLQYAAVRIAIEYDGGHHRASRRQWSLDIRRKENLDAEHWRVIVVTAEDIDQCPGATIARIHSALRARRHPGLPARLSDEWRPHFGRSPRSHLPTT